MALMKCKECGKEISTTAEICPHCGYRTDHGRSVTEAKGLLVAGGIFLVMIIVGALLILLNNEMFFYLIDVEYLEHYSYWEDETKTSFWLFVSGLVMFVIGAFNMIKLKGKAESIQGNGFTSNDSEK